MIAVKTKPQKSLETTINPETKICPLIASARTGLISADDAIMRTLPSGYVEKKVKDVLDYLLNGQHLKSDEKPLAKSIRQEMSGSEYVIMINGKNADPDDPIGKYVVKKQHKTKPYRALEIEVASVEEGGL
jgi:hypothetical protein